jgi:hypothetical protein
MNAHIHDYSGIRPVVAVLLISLAVTTMASAQDTLHPQELKPVAYGRSKQRLRDLPPPPVSLALPRKAEPIRLNPNVTVHLGPLVPDTVVTPPGQDERLGMRAFPQQPYVEGIGAGMEYQIQMAPPDTNGAVGETQFVQWVNNSIAIFNKRSRSLEFGPVPGNYLWKNFGGNCEENNNGDPVVQYDKLAKRWVLAQFSVTNGKRTGYSECIAISTSSDAGGDYWLYEFQYPSKDDYPKLGIWPDGYYVSFNMYDEFVDEQGNSTSKFLGARACVYDRESMLAGHPGRQECFQLPSDYFGLLPSDLDGTLAPPTGSPNYYVALGTNPDTLDLWRFKVNWKNAKNSTFGKAPGNSPDSTIPVQHYNLACNGTGSTCIPQPNKVEGQEQLDSLGDRLMFRVAYRRFSDHASLLLNHSVDTGGENSRTAVRWYELRDLEKAIPVVFQQGTYSPDETHRWIASLAMDRNGSIALGYTASGKTTYPGIRVAARLGSDPLSAIGKETVIREGTGIQTCNPSPAPCQCARKDGSCDTLTRWGDYSSITLDPVDDCTFWFTSEYQKDDGAFNWHTGIGSFTVGEGCGGARHSMPQQ